jgi:hypothetical protein
MLAHSGDCGEGSSVGTSPQLSHDHFGRSALVIAVPLPDADALGAMLDCGIHCQPLRPGCLPAITTLT